MKFNPGTRIAGFTVMEVLVVIIIVTILSALAIKPINGLIKRIRIQNAAEGLKHFLVAARSRATANSFVHCGVVFVDNGSTTASDSAFAFLDLSNPPNNVYDAGTDQRYLKKLVFKKTEGLEMNVVGATTIVFRGNGSANTSVKVALTLGNFVDTVDVLASTGRVKVKVQ